MPVKFWRYIYIQQAIPGVLCHLQTTVLHLNTQDLLQSTSWAHTSMQSPGFVSGEAYSWIFCGMQSLEASQRAPLKGQARGCPWTVHLVRRGGYPGECVSQSSREAILFSPGAPKRDVSTSAKLLLWGWPTRVAALHFHGNSSSCNREQWPNIARCQRLGKSSQGRRTPGLSFGMSRRVSGSNSLS